MTTLLLLGALLLTAVGLLYRNALLRNSERRLLEERAALRTQVEQHMAGLRQRNSLLSATVQRQAFSRGLFDQTHMQLHGMIDAMPSAIIGIDAQGRVSRWNSAAQDHTGLAAHQVLGHDIIEVVPLLADYRAALNAVLDNGETRFLGRLIQEPRQPQAPAEQQLKTHPPRVFDVAIYPMSIGDSQGAVLRMDDVSAQVGMEGLMVQNEKLLALGELAAGLAHEINNPLGAMIHNAQNLQRRLSPQLPRNLETAEALGLDLARLDQYLEQREVYRLLADIREAGDRAADVVRTMLAFSHRGSAQQQPVDPVQLVEHTLHLARSALRLDHPRHPEIVLDWQPPAAPLPAVPCVASEIQQVLLNLIRNAVDALAETLDQRDTAPRIRISVRQQGEHIQFDIADNGPGMDDQVRQRMFDPFFTTKAVGRGTGLGLSICYYIAHEHHRGELKVNSKPGRGSRFSLRLPLAGNVQSPPRALP